MKRYWPLAVITVSVIAVGYFAQRGSRSPNCVPVTTSSETAREFFERGRNLSERHKSAQAERLLEEAVTIDPDFASAWLQISRIHSNTERRIEALRRAVALASEVSEGERLQIVAAEARVNRRPSDAGAALEKLVQQYPADPRAHNDFGNYHYTRKNWPAAIEQYLIAIEIDPTFYEAYNGLGYCYRYQGNLRAAETFFLKYIYLLPDDPNPYDSYADMLTGMNRHEEAITYYRKALAIDSGFEVSHIGIAANYNMLGQYAEARDEIRHCLDGSPAQGLHHRMLIALATSYVFEGDFDQAAAQLREAADLARDQNDLPALAADLDRLGQVYLEAGMPDDAARAFVQSLQLAESSSEAQTLRSGLYSQQDHQQRMALVWLARGDLESAAACARKYQEMVSSLDDGTQVQLSHQTLGLVALATGQLDRAIAELSQSDLTHGYNLYHLAVAFERSGDLSQALKYYRYASNYDQFDPFGHAFVQRRALAKVEVSALLRAPRRPGPQRDGLPGPLAGETSISR
jgi:tetratricopeptide (TPR) repeat protein